MINRKWLTLVLCAGLVASAAGCGSSGNTNKGGAAEQTAGAQTESGSKPELKTLNLWSKDDYNTYTLAKVVEEQTGYKVKYEMLPADKAMDKLNLLISSAEPYDVITIAGEKAVYTDYAKMGALVDLTPLIDKYGGNIKASISPESFEAMKVDGKIYAIPNRASEFAGSSLLIRTDWLDKLGLKMPATLDELTAVLKAFKQKDPGGNGDKGAPLSIDGAMATMVNVTGAFGIATGWSEVDGKLVAAPLQPGFKEYLSYMSDLYKQGLLDKEFAVNKDATLKEKFTSGRAGVIPLPWYDIPGIADALTKNFPDAKYAYVPALKGKDGQAGLGMSGGFDRLTFIPKSSKHPEDAIKWINAKLDKDTFKLIAIGEEGKHFTYKDGVYSPILPLFTDERGLASNYLTGIDEKLYPVYWQARVQKDPRLFAGFTFLNREIPAEDRISDPLAMAPSLPEYSKNNASLNQMINDFAVKVIVGEESTGAVAAFIGKYNAAGGEASSKEVNEWYASVKK
ncbi:extracellular solute-binding protein [Paenibacillus graminis]|uniref:ABC transporter substrate-binding protein n=1 Tax=Paenibacillus graminis TaxID=189425 RepID=A0A089M3C7_9BACL|nr:extracellular solute-binding protein [Paenibacillus graminis]AIQ68286.1 ABC transporter substrate-binding protein [Paenibacillus graminis]MEC0172378.1 extracellular solute-binding protein [Paenibacillus graminis]